MLLASQITQSRVRITAYGKVPPREDESREEWLERYAEFLANNSKPKDNELASEYVERMMSPRGFEDNMLFIFDTLVACADLVGQGNRITPAVFEELSLLEVDDFIKGICKVIKFPIPELE